MPTPSSGCADFLKRLPRRPDHLISHDIEKVQDTVNKVFYLDANRQTIDIYNMGWKNYYTGPARRG